MPRNPKQQTFAGFEQEAPQGSDPSGSVSDPSGSVSDPSGSVSEASGPFLSGKESGPIGDDGAHETPPVPPPAPVPESVPVLDSGSVSDAAAGAEFRAASGEELSAPSSAASPACSTEPRPDLRDRLVVIIDSHSLIYQVFHALPPMSSPAGLPVAAVYGFLGDILELIARKSPDYLFCAFDKSEITFRNTLYPEYKAHRDGMPDELRLQIPLIRRTLSALSIGQLECSGFEADDILAKVGAEVEAAGGRCLIVTSDKDCRQLITDNVRLYNIRKNSEMGAAELWADWGVRPDQVVDYQALVGDPVDNVPGIPLVGPKLAQQLLEQYDTLEGVLDNASSVSGPKRRKNLEEGRERAMLSRQLVRLRTDVPCSIPWELGAVGGADLQQITTLCDEFGFRRLKDRARELLGDRGAGAAGGVGAASGTGAASDRSPAAAPLETSYRLIRTAAELEELVAILSECERISLDTETTGTNPRSSQLVGISVAWAPGEAAYIPVRAPEGDPQLEESVVIEALRPVLENPSIAKIGQNIKFDIIVLRGCSLDVRGVTDDTMVADYLLEPGQRNHTLDDLARRYLDHQTTPIKALIGTGKSQIRMDQVDVQRVADYAAEDADIPLRLAPLLRDGLEAVNLAELYDTIEIPLIDVLAEMEFNGIRVDVDQLAELSAGFATEIKQLREQIHALAGHEFNIDSPKQLAVVMFDELGLPVIKKTKTGPSTDVDVLQQLASLHALPDMVVAYRQATKLRNTYVEALPQLVCKTTGRVHTSFRQDVAATGRLSSSEPNLQNIPIRTEQGRAIRSAFTAGYPDWLLMGADYSQIELRVLAHFSGDEALLAAYAEDADIHRRVAAEVQGISESEVTDEMRRIAKTINFGIVYGQSAFGLARTLRIPQDEAAAYIDTYFARYPGVQTFMLRTLSNCRQCGYVETMLGRRRPVQGVRDLENLDISKRRSLTEPERIAVNTVIQGSAADLIKHAMLRVHARLKESPMPAKLLLQIHDELLFEVDPHAADDLETLVREEMIGVAELKVPLKVDVARGHSWAEA